MNLLNLSKWYKITSVRRWRQLVRSIFAVHPEKHHLEEKKNKLTIGALILHFRQIELVAFLAATLTCGLHKHFFVLCENSQQRGLQPPIPPSWPGARHLLAWPNKDSRSTTWSSHVSEFIPPCLLFSGTLRDICRCHCLSNQLCRTVPSVIWLVRLIPCDQEVY